MSKDNRDDFNQPIVRALAERAAYLCANPDCGSLTIGPSSDVTKSVRTGKAAHICAASPKGPRYDENQTPDQRSDIENGIWLCSVCADLIDKDTDAYSCHKIREWKRLHEEAIRHQGILPDPLSIMIETSPGLSIQNIPGFTITAKHMELLRQHLLVIQNRCNREIIGIEFEMQFPESIVDGPRVRTPPGAAVSMRPDRTEFVATMSGNAQVTQIGMNRTCPNYRVEIEKLLPQQKVEVTFLTILDEHSKLDFPVPMFVGSLMHYALGRFGFSWGPLIRFQKFVAAINYHAEPRHVTVEPLRYDVESVPMVKNMV